MAVGPPAGERIGGSLDGEDRAGIIQGEGKGDTRTEARWGSRSVRFPSLPAGINTDDSDPLGPDRGTVLSAAIGAAGNPRFGGGVAIVSPDFSVSARGKPISRGKPRKTKEFKESVAGTPPRFFPVHPPVCPCTEK